MKQKFTYLLSLMLMCIFGVSNAVAEKAVFSASTMTSQAAEGGRAAGNLWKGNGTNLAAGFTIQITGNLEKAYSAQNPSNGNFSLGTSFKNSNGAQNTITLPTGYTATSVKFYVTTNADADAKLSEINGTSCNDAVTSHKDGTNPTVITKDFAEPVNTFTFTFSTKQVFFIAEVTYAVPSNDPPTIKTDLKSSYSALKNEKLALSVDMTGATSYQWYKCNDANKTGAVAIEGATTGEYTCPTSAAGTVYYYCVGTNKAGSTTSTVASVFVENAKAVSRTWDFTKGATWSAGIKSATTLWEKNDDERYFFSNATTAEELKDNSGVLSGLENIYFTFGAKKLLLGVTSSGSKARLQMQGAGTVKIPGCSKGDKITISYCSSTKNKEVTISSDQLEEGLSTTSTSSTSGTVVVKSGGDLLLSMSSSVCIYKITVSSKYYFVTDFELSAEEVSVEEFENVTVSGTNYAPANYTDGTLNWTSSDENVATVKDGVITGVKDGKAIITATSVDGPSKTVAVVVTPCAPKNASIEMTSNSDVAAPKVESGKTFQLTAKAQGYGLTYQWAVKTSEKGNYSNISGATAQTYEATAVELGSKFYKVTVTNAQGSAVAEYEVKTVVPLQAFTIANEDGTGGISYKALDADEPQVKVCYQLTKADQEIDLIIPDSVEYAGLTYAVTTVGEEAFVNDNTIESLTTTPVLKEIGARAFMFCINLEEVNLADGIETIGDAAFFGCNAFTTFNIPGSVKYVGYKAFAECAALTDIYYDGTKAEWDALPNIGMAGIAKSVTIHFNDGETENGKGNIVGISNANADEAQKDGKFVENGQVVIYKNGKKYNAAGAEIK